MILILLILIVITNAFADALNGTLKDLHISDFGDFPTLDSKG